MEILYTKSKCLVIKQIGENSSALNGFVLEKDKPYEAFHGDVLEVLLSKYKYEIVFDPAPAAEKPQKSSRQSEKRKQDESIKREHPEKKAKLVVKPNGEDKWESFDGDKLLVFTSKNVTSSDKVCFVVHQKFCNSFVFFKDCSLRH